MVITSRQNDTVRRFRELLRSKSERDAQGLFCAEGDHLCREAVSAGLEIVSALATQRALEKYPDCAKALTEACGGISVISGELAEYISDTRAPQGVFALVRRRERSALSGSRIVMLDGVQDPGNVGTIIRTAEALGIDCAALSEDCADIYSPKTLRASMGSVFRLPCITGSLTEIIKKLRAEGFEVCCSALDETALRLGEFRFPEKAAAVIGSEGSGVSPAVRRECSSTLYIPISGAESLNAASAASIILWEMSGAGQRREAHKNSSA